MSITESFSYTEPEPEARQRWYNRRGPRAVAAGTVAVAIAATGIGVAVAANGSVAPDRAVAEAVDSLKVLPSAVTISSATEPGEVTLIATERGVQANIDTPDAAFDVALVDDRLFLRINRADTAELTGDPMAQGFLALFPSLSAALNGEWVSVDVSEDSPVLAEMTRIQDSEAGDPAALQAATEDLQQSLQAISEELRGQVRTAVEDNVEVTSPENAEPGPAGSDYYQVVLDGTAVRTDLEPALRSALDDLLSALDAFMAEAGAQLPQDGTSWEDARAELQGSFDEAMGEDVGDVTAEVWIADGELAQVEFDDLTLAFNPEPTLADLSGAVSLDDDLLRLLPWLSQLQSEGGLAGL